MGAHLTDDKDVDDALMGTSDASSLREILASLDAKQQALLPGHAVPMSIVVKTRTYDPDFYDALRTHPAAMSTDGDADPDEQMENLFY